MRVLLIDKTAGLASSHDRHEALAALPGLEVHVLGPEHWIENGREVIWQPPVDATYHPHLGKVFGKDYYARVGYYAGLSRAIFRSQPHLIQLLEEPWSVCAWQTVTLASLIVPGVKILFYTWENIYRDWTYPSRASSLYRLIDRQLHEASAGAVCASEEAKQVLLAKRYDRPIRIIPYGIPSFFFDTPPVPRDEAHPFTIGYIGRLMEMKGTDLLLRALVELPEARLLLVGSGVEERFRALAMEWGVAERIEWHPPVPEHQVPSFLQRMDVFVLPSRTTPGWKEQLGRAAIEAMALSVPVIGSNSGAIPEVIGDAGFIFAEDSLPGLVEILKTLEAQPYLREQYGRRGRERARQRFSWPRFAEALKTFFLEIFHS